MKLTDAGIILVSRYLTASNVGTMHTWTHKGPIPLNEKEVTEYWWTAIDNHNCEGIDLQGEDGGESEYTEIRDTMVIKDNGNPNSYLAKMLRKELPWILDDPKFNIVA